MSYKGFTLITDSLYEKYLIDKYRECDTHVYSESIEARAYAVALAMFQEMYRKGGRENKNG